MQSCHQPQTRNSFKFRDLRTNKSQVISRHYLCIEWYSNIALLEHLGALSIPRSHTPVATSPNHTTTCNLLHISTYPLETFTIQTSLQRRFEWYQTWNCCMPASIFCLFTAMLPQMSKIITIHSNTTSQNRKYESWPRMERVIRARQTSPTIAKSLQDSLQDRHVQVTRALSNSLPTSRRECRGR